MNINKSKNIKYRQLEDVIGCKWSVTVLTTIACGVRRPGELERAIPGISTKVLNERLKKLANYGLILKETFPVSPPKTEFRLSEYGKKLIKIIKEINALNSQINYS